MRVIICPALTVNRQWNFIKVDPVSLIDPDPIKVVSFLLLIYLVEVIRRTKKRW